MHLTAAVERRPLLDVGLDQSPGSWVGGAGGAGGADPAGRDGDAVAVALVVLGGGGDQLLRVVEGALGWVVVDPGDPVLPARCVIADVAAVSSGLVPAQLPLVLLLDAGETSVGGGVGGGGVGGVSGVDPLAVARAAQDAVAVLDGVPDAAQLRAVVEGVAVGDGGAPWCVLAGAAGGVGTTTVALAVAGLRAWSHGRTLVAARGPTHLTGAPSVAAADLASPAVWAAATPAVGVPELRVVALTGSASGGRAPEAALVLDVGVVAPGGPSPDVLVLRPDRAGVDALAASVASYAVVVGRGALTPADVRAAAGGRSVVELASSARVARACVAGRMPTDAPGAWLRPLAELVAALVEAQGSPLGQLTQGGS